MRGLRDVEFDSVFDSQKIFRILLDSMARPGKLGELPDINIEAPVENRYSLLLLLALLDREVSFSVRGDGGVDLQAVRDYLELNTGSRQVAADNCDFMLVYGGSSDGQILNAKVGDLAYPNESTTVLYDIGSISDEEGSESGEVSTEKVVLELRGPGIKDKRRIGFTGIEREEIEALVFVREFPLGIDAIFSDRQGRIACIPRSTQIKVL